MKRTKVVNLISIEDGEYGYPERHLYDWIRWFQEKLLSVPPEYRDSAVVDVDTFEDDGCLNNRIEINYERPETDEEEAIREQVESMNAAQKRQYELDLLAKLKAKYEPTAP